MFYHSFFAFVYLSFTFPHLLYLPLPLSSYFFLPFFLNFTFLSLPFFTCRVSSLPFPFPVFTFLSLLFLLPFFVFLYLPCTFITFSLPYFYLSFLTFPLPCFLCRFYLSFIFPHLLYLPFPYPTHRHSTFLPPKTLLAFPISSVCTHSSSTKITYFFAFPPPFPHPLKGLGSIMSVDGIVWRRTKRSRAANNVDGV